ncbi:hypothetical protein P8452_31838 [Trifolium repens]|nr:hypothetical protein P8452_31838 [Trifolium repens]
MCSGGCDDKRKDLTNEIRRPTPLHSSIALFAEFHSSLSSCFFLMRRFLVDRAKSCAHEVTKVIMKELGDRQFSVLIDESRDISVKEQMAVMLRYVNDKGKVVERFLAIHKVEDTTSEALKEALYDILGRQNTLLAHLNPGSATGDMLPSSNAVE